MKPLKVAILGSGEVAKDHVRAFKSLKSQVEIIGVADIIRERALTLAKTCQAQAFSDYQDLLQLSPHIAVICLPHHLHRQAGTEAASAGCHILMEKPLATSLEEAQEILDACNQNGVLITVGFVHRFRREFQHAFRLIKENRIGQPRMIADHFTFPGGSHVPNWVWSNHQSGGGVLMYTGIHSIDRARWLLQSEVQQVTATAVNYRESIASEEGMSAILVFENGSVATLIGNQPAYRVDSVTKNVEVFGTQACLRIRAGESLEFSSDQQAYRLQITMDDHFATQARYFVDAIRNGKSPAVTGEDGLRALEVTVAIHRSAKLGRTVKIEEVRRETKRR